MKTVLKLLLACCFLFLTGQLYAQHSHSPGEEHTMQQQHSDSAAHGGQHHEEAGKTEGWDHPTKVTADFEDFPNLHPLFVHFPIVLLPFAALFQLLAFFYFRRELSWVVLIMAFAGFVGAYIAANFAHPHVGDLPAHTQQVFNKHNTYATWTLWLSGIAFLLKAGSHFLLHRVTWAEGVVALVLLGCAFTVSMAGHHGSQLVFIENVGPQGKYLESGHHSDEGHTH